MKKILFFFIIIFLIGGLNIYYNIKKVENKKEDIKKDIIYLSSFYNKNKDLPNKIITENENVYWINKNSFLGKEFEELEWDYYEKTKIFSKRTYEFEELKGNIFFNSFNKLEIDRKKKKLFTNMLNLIESFSIGSFFYSDVDYTFLKINKINEGFIKKEKYKISFYPIKEFEGNYYYTPYYYSCYKKMILCQRKNNKKDKSKVKKENLQKERIYFINFN